MKYEYTEHDLLLALGKIMRQNNVQLGYREVGPIASLRLDNIGENVADNDVKVPIKGIHAVRIFNGPQQDVLTTNAKEELPRLLPGVQSHIVERKGTKVVFFGPAGRIRELREHSAAK